MRGESRKEWKLKSCENVEKTLIRKNCGIIGL
jgi:hypothetical protein